jgi:hypothetical protein
VETRARGGCAAHSLAERLCSHGGLKASEHLCCFRAVRKGAGFRLSCGFGYLREMPMTGEMFEDSDLLQRDETVLR